MEELEMKKALCLLLAMLMILAICACAAKEPATAAPNSENSQSTTKENAEDVYKRQRRSCRRYYKAAGK